jgi:hypothetical protein
MSVNDILAVKNNVELELLKKPGVNGVGISYKLVDSQETDELVIRVYVKKKMKNLPEGWQIPPVISGVKTDVIEDPLKPVLQSTGDDVETNSYPYVAGGMNVGLERLFDSKPLYGTLGAILLDNQPPSNQSPYLLLSCYHVIAVNNDQTPGANISQPGGRPDRIIAKLRTRAFDNYVDAATATIIGDTSNILAEIRDGDNIVTKITGTISRTELDTMSGKRVMKRGIGSRVTYGTIEDSHYTHPSGFEYPFIGQRYMKDQIRIKPEKTIFSNDGDSGSCIIDEKDGRVIGLLTGAAGPISVASHIDYVLSRVNARLYTG